MNILDEIIANKKNEVGRQKEAVPINRLEKIISEQTQTKKRSFSNALINSSSGIIAEFKRKSPSKGWIFQGADVTTVVSDYEREGASAVSILTDELFFGGSFDDLKTARKRVQLPLLRKDFIIDEYQIFQAKALEADVILLIASALSSGQVSAYSKLAQALSLEVLLEIHNEQELEYIQEDIDVVGINNRDLLTFKTDIRCSFNLGDKIPPDYIKISESGISDAKVICELRQAGFSGFLVGENFMKTDQPGNALKGFIEDIESENQVVMV